MALHIYFCRQRKTKIYDGNDVEFWLFHTVIAAKEGPFFMLFPQYMVLTISFFMTSYEGSVNLHGSYGARLEHCSLRRCLSLALYYDQVIKGVFTLYKWLTKRTKILDYQP